MIRIRPNDHGYVGYRHCEECRVTWIRKMVWISMQPGVKASEMRPPTMEEKRLAFARELRARFTLEEWLV